MNKYALNDWYSKVNQFDADDSGYLVLKSKGRDNEIRYRYPAGMAFGVAIALKTGVYSQSVVSLQVSEATEKTIKLLTAIAYDHKANQKCNIWGGDWQQPAWRRFSSRYGARVYYPLHNIDQVYGQSWAFQVGLPRVLSKDKALAALKDLWKYNFTADVGLYIKTW